jgi:hypothetical protein
VTRHIIYDVTYTRHNTTHARESDFKERPGRANDEMTLWDEHKNKTREEVGGGGGGGVPALS